MTSISSHVGRCRAAARRVNRVLIALSGGIVFFAIGAAAGALIGWLVDLEIVGVDVEIVDTVAGYLSPGQSALVTEIDDESFITLQTDSDFKVAPNIQGA